MSDEKKWPSFIPDGIERWLRGRDADRAPGVEWRPDAPKPRRGEPGVLWSAGGSNPDVCPVCGAAYLEPPGLPGGSYCPSCGAERVAGTPMPYVPSLVTDADVYRRRPCAVCGGEVDVEGYCMVCGTKQAGERDHYREEPAVWVAGVCDRGVRHTRNEDAIALAAGQRPGSQAVLVVCDGVSTSQDSDIAALAAAQRARDEVSSRHPGTVGNVAERTAAISAALVDAAARAQDAVIATTAADSENAASCTFAAAVVVVGTIVYANIGDSRVYWLPDGSEPVQVSVDDSVAQARIEMGVPRDIAENSEGAHAITKWLGKDSTDIVPRVGTLDASGKDGWVLVCSDGLWNYASTADAIGNVLAGAIAEQPAPAGLVDVCERMVAWANAQGGKDNVSVALARLGSRVVGDVPADDPADDPVSEPLPSSEDAEPAATTAAAVSTWADAPQPTAFAADEPVNLDGPTRQIHRTLPPTVPE